VQEVEPFPKLTPFHGVRSPPILLENYLKRISQYTKCSPACFVLAVAYMDAMRQVRLTLFDWMIETWE